jgi:hypothetical protein
MSSHSAGKPVATEKYPALNWNDLGHSVQLELAKKGLGAEWFALPTTTADLRRTVLTLYVKMTGTPINGRSLWDFVGQKQRVDQGSLEFLALPSIVFLMGALKGAPSKFTDPGNDPTEWDSRECIAHMQLHFKRKERDWNWKGQPNRVEVHIDPHGLYSGPGIGRLNVFQMLCHGFTQKDFTKVGEIQEWLVKKNWGKTILFK